MSSLKGSLNKPPRSPVTIDTPPLRERGEGVAVFDRTRSGSVYDTARCHYEDDAVFATDHFLSRFN